VQTRKSILLVEDDDQFRRLVKAALTFAGFDVREARDGLEALTMVERQPPDLIVLDLLLPGIDGIAVGQDITARADTRHIPVVVVTGSQLSVAHLNPACVLRKPLSPDDIVAAVEACVGESGDSQETSTPRVPDRLRGPRVLVVDDDASNREFAARVLLTAGYVVNEASDGPEALGILAERGHFDLYVLDYMMPGMSGTQLAERIRQSQPDAKTLYFTAFSSHLFKDTNLLRDDEAFIEKPASIQALREAASLLLFGHIHGPSEKA
jgi:adenylate cyclase